MFGSFMWNSVNTDVSVVFTCMYLEVGSFMEKSNVFNTELNYIEDDKIRESTKYLLDRLPDYFYVMPASTSGKHHPEFSLGEGGLVRHTKAAVKIAMELFRNDVFNRFDGHEQDLIIMALILHDGLKQGWNEKGHTCFEHPLLVSKFIFENISSLSMKKIDSLTVMRLIKAHMGPWNTDKEGNVVLPVPTLYDEKFVHLCDYIASRNFLNINFIDNEIVDSVDRQQIKVLKK